jgi:RimJ/RimL family protein N-acetyltransferase
MTVVMRKPKEGDAEARAKLGYHPDVLRGYGLKREVPAQMPIKDAMEWVSRIATHPNAWILEYNSKLLGEVRLDNLDMLDRRASLAIAIVDYERLGQGLGREAIKACLKIAFGVLMLHRVSVRVLSSNIRAIRCYEASGFQIEGVERGAALTDSGWEDDVIMGILAP